MVVYICKHCRFRFNANNPKDCPYCGRNTLEREKTATELLDEVENMLEDKSNNFRN
ncbi:MAG: hypothetical protein ACP5OG_02685 [Candidatus Nanoarchaeia archaeon]